MSELGGGTSSGLRVLIGNGIRVNHAPGSFHAKRLMLRAFMKARSAHLNVGAVSGLATSPGTHPTSARKR